MSDDSGTRHTLWKVGWGVTARCNMRCSFCYSRAARSGAQDAPLPMLKAFVDANYASITSINYGTGENSLAADWYELLKYVRAYYPHIGQALTTNGYLAPALERREDHAQVLAALDEVDVSVDFCDSRHNAWRGHPRAQTWAAGTVALCRQAGIRTTMVVLGHDETLALDNLDRVFDVAATLGCFVRINILRPSGDLALQPLSYAALRRALDYALGQHRVVALSDPLFAALILGERVEDASGKTSLRILPDGAITPSTYLVSREWQRAHISTARLDTEEFARALAVDGEPGTLPTACENCEVAALCGGGAFDRRVLWYGTLRERDPYCPYHHGETPAAWHPVAVPVRVPGPRIHDGYLPTLIFSP
jgi:radical SAM protein with 4Fe4S-binding SPASM domain